MVPLFSHPSGMAVLESLRIIFQTKPVYLRKQPFFVFVCGGKMGNGETSLRQPFIQWAEHNLPNFICSFFVFVCGGKMGNGETSLRHQFIQWAEHNLPNFICLLAEDALKDGFVVGRRRFIDLARFESVIAGIADCVLIFPESPGSFAETGFFSNSKNIRDKTLVINPIDKQKDSFLNMGPIHTIDRFSFLKPTVFLGELQPADFAHLGQRLVDRMKETHREREQLDYRKFAQLKLKEKLSVVFEILRLLRLADFWTLGHAISICFESNPPPQELADLLRILQAAKFVQRDEKSSYFRVVAGPNLIEIENVDIDKIHASVTLFYQREASHLLKALQEAAS